MSKLSKAVKKTASVTVAAASGFVGGGSVGAVAGTVKGIINNTKTSDAHAITARYAGQSLVTGAVANIAAGAVAAGAHALAPAAGVAAPATGAAGVKAGALSFFAGGGLAGGLLKAATAAAPAVAAALNSGKETIKNVSADDIAHLRGTVGSVRQGLGNARDAYRNITDGQPANISTPVNITSGDENKLPLLAGLGILAFMLVKRRHG